MLILPKEMPFWKNLDNYKINWKLIWILKIKTAVFLNHHNLLQHTKQQDLSLIVIDVMKVSIVLLTKSVIFELFFCIKMKVTMFQIDKKTKIKEIYSFLLILYFELVYYNLFFFEFFFHLWYNCLKSNAMFSIPKVWNLF